MKRFAALAAAAAITLQPVAFPVSAVAAEPYHFDPGRDRPPPPQDNPDPGVEMKQQTECATSAVLDDSQFHTIPAHEAFSVDKLHDFATGKGVTVGVIDSGVQPNVRLPHLRGAGDYVANDGDGLHDCDHHGTLIAGIIAASPARDDSFVGIAPDADILSIRQTSSAYTVANHDDEPPSSLSTLAKSVRRATDEGAQVINMSVTACYPATKKAELSELAGALAYAASKDVVLVASAGNVGDDCDANPGPDPEDADDPRGWDTATTISVPSMFDDFVLSVGGVGLQGHPYPKSLPGPWVDVSAPAESIVSLDPVSGETGGLINADVTQQGVQPITGTSFAAAYVSGLAALMKQAHPDWSAVQIRRQITETAHHTPEAQNNLLGNGIVDSVAALTNDPAGDRAYRQHIDPASRREPQPISQINWWPIGGGLATILGAVLVGVWLLFRRHVETIDPPKPSGDIEPDPDEDVFKERGRHA